ncbi:MAG: NifB/NifX family molybdenum-iron cluster-binding protein [Desulfobacter sp.]|nr:NifB/NifX family molybdenum-iron cluster-binding protein [Desulfobacter sp.]
MKIAVSAYGEKLDSKINPRFGRCDYLLIVDTENDSVEAFSNENINRSGGAGIQSAGFVIDKGIEAVLTGDCGPKAMGVFNSSSIAVYTGQTGTVKEAVERFKQGKMTATTTATAPEKAGMGSSSGVSDQNSQAGPGMTGGRGMGGGGGQGMGGGQRRR